MKSHCFLQRHNSTFFECFSNGAGLKWPEQSEQFFFQKMLIQYFSIFSPLDTLSNFYPSILPKYKSNDFNAAQKAKLMTPVLRFFCFSFPILSKTALNGYLRPIPWPARRGVE